MTAPVAYPVFHFAHIEAWYAHRFRTTLHPHTSRRQRRRLSELEYEYRRLSDCPSFAAVAANNMNREDA